ncbi:MAG: endonuclease domain-containing protein [Pseudomonadota bacterium]
MSVEFARRLRAEQTDAEAKLWTRLRNRQLGGWKFKRQTSKGPYIADFYCAKARLIVELDGGQHGEDANFAHDKKRTTYLNENGQRVIRFWNNEVTDNLDGVLETILHHLEKPPFPNDTDHSLSPSGRGLG